MSKDIRIRLKEKEGVSKLSFVKVIKYYTDLGLKDSKDLADKLFSDLETGINGFTHMKLKNSNDFKSFVNSVGDIGIKAYIVSGVQFDRDLKMLSIGIGEKEDYIGFISEHVKNTRDISDILDMVLSKMDKNQLNEIINEIKLEYDSSL
jgi:hypothetical protein